MSQPQRTNQQQQYVQGQQPQQPMTQQQQPVWTGSTQQPNPYAQQAQAIRQPQWTGPMTPSNGQQMQVAPQQQQQLQQQQMRQQPVMQQQQMQPGMQKQQMQPVMQQQQVQPGMQQQQMQPRMQQPQQMQRQMTQQPGMQQPQIQQQQMQTQPGMQPRQSFAQRPQMQQQQRPMVPMQPQPQQMQRQMTQQLQPSQSANQSMVSNTSLGPVRPQLQQQQQPQPVWTNQVRPAQPQPQQPQWSGGNTSMVSNQSRLAQPMQQTSGNPIAMQPVQVQRGQAVPMQPAQQQLGQAIPMQLGQAQGQPVQRRQTITAQPQPSMPPPVQMQAQNSAPMPTNTNVSLAFDPDDSVVNFDVSSSISGGVPPQQQQPLMQQNSMSSNRSSMRIPAAQQYAQQPQNQAQPPQQMQQQQPMNPNPAIYRTSTDASMLSDLGAQPIQPVTMQQSALSRPSIPQNPGNSFAVGGAGMQGDGRPPRGFSIGNMSAIALDEDQSHMHFLDDQDDRQSIFGTGNIGPDRIRMSVANSIMAMKRTDQANVQNKDGPPAAMSNSMLAQDQLEQYEGEFRIEKGFTKLELISDWCVCNPQKPQGVDYIMYTVIGCDSTGKFEIFRRYSDFWTLRELFLDRWAGLYIPPIPSKRTVGNTKTEFISERCFLLNLFIRQLARCPYLAESEEFAIFVRPQSSNIKRELSLLARISPEQHLGRIQKYFSFIGSISDPAIQEQVMQITQFKINATSMLTTLKKFKEHLDVMEAEFEQAITNDNQLSNMLHQYEVNMNEQFGNGQLLNNRELSEAAASQQAQDFGASNENDQSSFMVFDQLQNSIADDENLNDWQKLTSKMQNPFTIMRRWLKFEILDLEAILNAIDSSNEMDKKMNVKVSQRNTDMKTLRELKDGKDTFRTFFRSKEGKINKITTLTDNIQRADRDIECLSLLYKIVVLQLNQAAIQFFKREKFGTYNHTINLYAVKQIENTSLKHQLFKKLRDINTTLSTSHLDVSISQAEANRISTRTADSNMPQADGQSGSIVRQQDKPIIPFLGHQEQIQTQAQPDDQMAFDNKPEKQQELVKILGFMALGEGMDPNSSVELNDIVELDDLQQEIRASQEAEAMEKQSIPATCHDTIDQLPSRDSSVRQSVKVVSKVGEKDELLRYQIHSNKEDNEMLDGLLGGTEQMIEVKSDSMKDGDLISTDKNNMTLM